MANSTAIDAAIGDFDNDYLIINEEVLEKIINYYVEKHYQSTAAQIDTRENGELVVLLEPL